MSELEPENLDYFGTFLNRIHEARAQTEQEKTSVEALISTTESLYEVIGDREDGHANTWRDVADYLSLSIAEECPEIELPESLQLGAARMAKHVEELERREATKGRLKAVGHGFIRMSG